MNYLFDSTLKRKPVKVSPLQINVSSRVIPESARTLPDTPEMKSRLWANSQQHDEALRNIHSREDKRNRKPGVDSGPTSPEKLDTESDPYHTPDKKASDNFRKTGLKSGGSFLDKLQRNSLMIALGTISLLAVWLIGLSGWFYLHMKNKNKEITTHETEEIEVSDGQDPDSPVVWCFENTDCTAPKSYCDTLYSKQCSVCISSDQCTTPGKTHCDVYGSRECHECLIDKDCANPLVCDSIYTRTCVQCVMNSDCASQGTNKACNTETNTCVRCTADSHCALEATNTKCDLVTNACVPP